MKKLKISINKKTQISNLLKFTKMKKTTIYLILILSTISLSSLYSNNLRELKMSINETDAQLKNPEYIMLVKKFTKDAFVNPTDQVLVDSFTKKFEGKDKNGIFILKLITFKSKLNSSVLISKISFEQNKTVLNSTWAEDDLGNFYIVKDKKVLLKKGKPSIFDCINKFNVSSCINCVSCVKNCINSKGKLIAKIFCTAKCMPSCITCGINVVGFISCMVSAIKG